MLKANNYHIHNTVFTRNVKNAVRKERLRESPIFGNYGIVCMYSVELSKSECQYEYTDEMIIGEFMSLSGLYSFICFSFFYLTDKA